MFIKKAHTRKKEKKEMVNPYKHNIIASSYKKKQMVGWYMKTFTYVTMETEQVM